MKASLNEATKILSKGEIGVIPTDTIYGIVGSALKPTTVRKIYRLRKRSPNKPFIILIGSFRHLKLFGVRLGSRDKYILRKLWPGKVSVILPCLAKKFFYLHRGTKTLAFRLPKNKKLVKLLKRTGPLVAPSANFEGKPPARAVREAQKYFGDKAGFYIDGGRVKSRPSTLVSLNNGRISLVRPGAVKLKETY